MTPSTQKIRQITTLLFAMVFGLEILTTARAQGTITFDSNPAFNGTDYYESGMGFHVIMPTSQPYHDWIVGAPGTFANEPLNSTPYFYFFRQNTLDNYVSFSFNDNTLFGLNAVQLADPNSPSPSAVSISFIGYLSGGSTVTETFTTPGSGATSFANYTFNSDFASGLTKVDVLGQKWAMDNLSFTVPEPSAFSLLIMGALLDFGMRGRRA